MFKKGKTLFLTIAYPPNPTASAVVHRHLLDQFDPASFVVLSAFFPGAKKAAVPAEVNKHFIYLSFEFISSKIHRAFARLQKFSIPILLRLYIALLKPARIVIGFPDLYWLNLCSAVAIKKNIPFVPYLHDTIVEATYASASKQLAQEVQDRIFNKAYAIAVMSEGMRSLYQKKYRLNCIAWEHIYPEQPMYFNKHKENRAHWSGDVYEVNYKSVARLNNALQKNSMQFSISNGKTKEQLQTYGIVGGHIEKVFYPQRSEYLQQLNKSKIVLLALNYADECNVHEDELASIFSTKTPEYLGSGSLIVYHGPSHYFLAKFILDNDCGIVIDSRDEDTIAVTLKHVTDHYEEYENKISNAAKSLAVFNPAVVIKKVISTLDA
jgi:hypothetical protein